MELAVALFAALVSRNCPDELLDVAANLVHARKIPGTYAEMARMLDDVIVLAAHEATTEHPT